MQLPKDFEEYTRSLMGDSLYSTLIEGLSETPPVSIRLNPFKISNSDFLNSKRYPNGLQKIPVQWAKDSLLLSERPSFTLDPLFHAGAYYVQEASSTFIDFVIRQLVKEPITMLDLCAAPGGKTTCAMSALPKGSVLYSNEPIRARANILAENVIKFGHPNIIVTNNYAKDYAKTGKTFDLILTDVPCSGEGMFRKDPNAINEWSAANVEACWKLQRSIVEDIWPCLNPGGILVYSTCTFNAKEDEDNVQWIIDNLGAESIKLEGVKEEWNITGALKGNLPVYRFIPGKTKGEGLFMAVLRKNGKSTQGSTPALLKKEGEKITSKKERGLKKEKGLRGLKILAHGVNASMQKGKKIIPDVSLALTIEQEKNNYPHVEVDYDTAIKYLRRESIVLPPDTPRGIVTICFEGLGLGFANNIGNRANNLYPQEWRIKTTHIK